MYVNLSLDYDTDNRVIGGSAKVIRENDKRVYKESTFWYNVKQSLRRQGYDVIVKRMWKDGHMRGDHEFYVRSRKLSTEGFMISQTDNALRLAYEDYNKEGRMGNLSVDPILDYEEIEGQLRPLEDLLKRTWEIDDERTSGEVHAASDITFSMWLRRKMYSGNSEVINKIKEYRKLKKLLA